MKTRLTILPLLMVSVTIAIFGQSTDIAEKKIAITFEEIPFMKPLGFWRPREISNIILRTLEQDKILAAGFVVQEKIENDTSTYVILSDWVSRGHILGNQTWGDADFNVLTYDQFIEHLRDGQKYLSRVAKAEPFNYRYLRFPQLHEGNEPKKRKKLLKVLAKADYQVAHVSIKTLDWAFNQSYLEYEQDPTRLEALKEIYLGHLAEMLDYSEKQSLEVFGRNIPHILQLHCGIATAGFLGDTIKMLQERGYQFVSFPEALSDSAYQTEEEYVGPLGLTFIDRVAATRGLPFDQDSGVPGEQEIRRRIASVER